MLSSDQLVGVWGRARTNRRSRHVHLRHVRWGFRRRSVSIDGRRRRERRVRGDDTTLFVHLSAAQHPLKHHPPLRLDAQLLHEPVTASCATTIRATLPGPTPGPRSSAAPTSDQDDNDVDAAFAPSTSASSAPASLTMASSRRAGGTSPARGAPTAGAPPPAGPPARRPRVA